MPDDVYHFSAWLLAIPFAVAGLTGLPAVLLLRRRMWRPAIPLGLIAGLAGVVFAPAMWFDEVRVSDAAVVQTTGLPMNPTAKGFRFAEVAEVHIREKPVGPKK